MPCIQCTGNPFTIITLAANLWQAACSGQDPPAAAEPAPEIGLPLSSAVANTLRNAMGGRAARRGLASEGACVLTAAGHEDEIRGIVESPHTNPPSALAMRAAKGAEIGQVEVFARETEISDGDQVLRLYEVTTIPHVNPKVLAYVEGDGIVFQSDWFFGGPRPDAIALYEAVTALGLEVSQVVGDHGGVIPGEVLMALGKTGVEE